MNNPTGPALQLPGYQILAKVGTGGMGAVYKAKHLKTGRIVAVKMLRSDSRVSRTIERFINEIESLGRVRHPNVVAALDAGFTGGNYYYVMEFIEGESSEDVVKLSGPLNQERCIDIMKQMTHALEALHKNNILHRDIKPSNILLTHEGTAKLCDLGISKAVDSEEEQSLTGEGMMLGTPRYMSPEQIRGEAMDGRSDLYSLATSIYHAATGRAPFESSATGGIVAKHLTEKPPDPRTFNKKLSKGFATLLLKLLEKKPENRYQSPGELRTALEQLASGKAPVGFPKIPWILVGIAAALLIAVVLVFLPGGGSGPEPEYEPPIAEEGETPVEEEFEEPVEEEIGEAGSEPDEPQSDRMGRLDDLRVTWNATRDPAILKEIFQFIAFGKARDAGTPMEERWDAVAESVAREANEVINQEWKEHAAAAHAALKRGDFRAAVSAADGLPRAYRELASGRLSDAEKERRALEEEIDRQARAALETEKSALENADLKTALGRLSKMAGRYPPSFASEIEGLGAALNGKIRASFTSAPLTQARYEELRQQLAPLAADGTLGRRVAPLLQELTRARNEAVSQAQSLLGEARVKMGLGPLFQERDYEAIHKVFDGMLTDPGYAISFEGNVQIGPSKGRTRREHLEKTEAALRQLANRSDVPEVIALLGDLRATLLMQGICERAWNGIGPAGEAHWKKLHLSLLWTASQVRANPSSDGRLYTCNVKRSFGSDASFSIAPVTKTSLTAGDVVLTAEKSYASAAEAAADPHFHIGAALLLYFSGDPSGTRKHLDAIQETQREEALLGLAGYVAGMEQIAGAGKPSPDSPTGGTPAQEATFKVEAEKRGDRTYRLTYGFDDAEEAKDFEGGAVFGDGTSLYSGRVGTQIRNSGLTMNGSGILLWSPEVEGDLTAEVEFKFMGSIMTRVAFLLYYAANEKNKGLRSRDKARQPDQGYALQFRTERDGRRYEGRMQLTKKAKDLDDENHRLVTGQTYVLRIVRKGRNIDISLQAQGTPGSIRLRDRDDSWNRGQFGIALSNGRIEVKKLELTATVTREWLQSR